MHHELEQSIVEALISKDANQKQAALEQAYRALTSDEHVDAQRRHFAWAGPECRRIVCVCPGTST